MTKSIPRSLALVALGAVMFYGIGTAAAGAQGPATEATPRPGCPHAAADNAAATPMMDNMKAHLEGMKSAVGALRESEKKFEATEDPKAFRAAVVEHLKKLDDLQASHLAPMEQMMGRMHGGMSEEGHGDCPDCRCKECKCGDCRCKGCKDKEGGHKGDCCCHCGKEGGHGR